MSWNDGDTTNPRSITVYDSATYTAFFALNEYRLSVESSNAEQGLVYGGGIFEYNTQTTIAAFPFAGYHFDQWSDGISDNPRNITVVRDSNLIALFAQGNVRDTTYIFDTTYVDVIIHDTTIVTQWQYDTTYVDVFVPVHDTTIVTQWQYDTTYVDVIVPVHDTTIVDNYIYDTTYVDRWQYDTTYVDVIVPVHDTTIVTQWQYDTTYVDVLIHDTAFIDVYIYDTVTVTEPLDYYSLTVLSADMEKGLVAGNGSFPEGTMVEIAAVPMVGYRFEGWQDGNTENPRTVTVGQDMTFTASFTASTQSIDVSETASHLIYTRGTQIVVENAENARVRIFDVVGRCISVSDRAEYYTIFNMPTSGAYFVQVGNYPAQKVVVIE